MEEGGQGHQDCISQENGSGVTFAGGRSIGLGQGGAEAHGLVLHPLVERLRCGAPFEALELYARVVQRIEPDGDTPEAGAEGEVTHAG